MRLSQKAVVLAWECQKQEEQMQLVAWMRWDRMPWIPSVAHMNECLARQGW